MMTRSLAPSILSRFTEYFRPQPFVTPHHDGAHAERDFIHQILRDAPDAFSGELDVQNMMHLYPGRF